MPDLRDIAADLTSVKAMQDIAQAKIGLMDTQAYRQSRSNSNPPK
jgi:hypothetical protein